VTTLLGVDLVGRRVVVVGGGSVGTRRAAGLAAEGAHVVLVDPAPSPAARQLAAEPAPGRVHLVERPITEHDVDAAWLVVAATAVPDVDTAVARWCEERRTWCVHGGSGSARTVATTRHDGLVVGVVSDGEPDPRRVAVVRDALAQHLLSGAVDLRRRRPEADGA
jgi:uroporphyrin-III C-methyltransferase/precorrin-2 dehydrogenase/sirohydrochlorin ferrochelatase